jgi:hypothetical protein
MRQFHRKKGRTARTGQERKRLNQSENGTRQTKSHVGSEDENNDEGIDEENMSNVQFGLLAWETKTRKY